MMAEIAVYPTKQAHFTPTIAKALEEIKKCEVQYQLGPMSTSIEGTADQVFLALRKVYEKLAHSEERLFMNISLDSSPTQATSLADRVSAVEAATTGSFR